MENCVVTKADLVSALQQLELAQGDLCMVHSSMKSFGHVQGGPQTIINALEEVLGEEGTLVMPTFAQKDFQNVYNTWHMDKPSEVGALTEYFRKLPSVLRSNNPTHSVAARGKLAYELICEHETRYPHPLAQYGERCFCDTSPWMKLYPYNAKSVFLGCRITTNTIKHLVQLRVVEYFLSQVRDPLKYAELRDRLSSYHTFATDGTWKGVWPDFDCWDIPAFLQFLRDQANLKETQCGNAHLLCVGVRDYYDACLTALLSEPKRWFRQDFLDWAKECMDNAIQAPIL